MNYSDYNNCRLHRSSYRGHSGMHVALQMLDNLLEQRGTQVEMVAVHWGLQAAGKLLPRS